MVERRMIVRAMGAGEEMCAPVRGVPAVLWAVGVHTELLGRRNVVVVTENRRVAAIVNRADIDVSGEMIDGEGVDVRGVFDLGHDGVMLEGDWSLDRVRAWVESHASSDLLFQQAARCALWRAVDAGGVQAVICDVDGTLTDGKVYMPGSGGGAGRAFHTHDGLGMQMLMGAGIKVGWLSATGDGGSIDARAEMVGVGDVDWGQGEKGSRVERLCERMGVDLGRVVYVGDDVNDLPAMAVCGASACPADAAAEVRREATLVMERVGGQGAVRELAGVVLATV